MSWLIRPSKFRFPDNTDATTRSLLVHLPRPTSGQRPRVPDARRAPVTHHVEPQLVQVRHQPRPVKCHDHPRPRRQRRLHPRLRRQPPLHRLLRQQRRPVITDGFDVFVHDVIEAIVTDHARSQTPCHPAPPPFFALGRPISPAPPPVCAVSVFPFPDAARAHPCRDVSSTDSSPFSAPIDAGHEVESNAFRNPARMRQGHPILRPLRPRNARHHRREVQLQLLRVLRLPGAVMPHPLRPEYASASTICSSARPVSLI